MRYLQEKLRIEEDRKGDDAEGGRDTKGHIAFGEYEMGGMAMNSDSDEDEDIFLLDEELPERIRQLLASPSTEAKKPRRKSTKEKEKEREKEKEEDAHTVKYDDANDSDGYGALLDDDYETVRRKILTPCQVSSTPPSRTWITGELFSRQPKARGMLWADGHNIDLRCSNKRRNQGLPPRAFRRKVRHLPLSLLSFPPNPTSSQKRQKLLRLPPNSPCTQKSIGANSHT